MGRAIQLATLPAMPPREIQRMRDYFRRHTVDTKAAGFGREDRPTPGFVAWLLWGGDEGRDWAREVAGQMDRMDAEREGARKRGSRDALRAEDWTGLVVGESESSTPAIVLVDLRVLEDIHDLDELEERTEAILGFIATDYPKDYHERPTSDCNDKDGRSPLQVSMSVAQKGWGPLTYDAALWVVTEEGQHDDRYNGYLMPDRNNVFSGAQKVWTHYAEKRKADVQIRKIGTRCPSHGYPDPDPVLDRMYKAKLGRPAFAGMDALYQRWAAVRDDLEERLGMDREEIEAALVKMGEQLFGEKIGR